MRSKVHSGNPHMSTVTHSSDSIVQSSIPSQEQINLERGQLEAMEYGEKTTSPKIALPGENTDSRGCQTGDRIPHIQTITAGASGPEIKHFSEEAVGKMVSAYLQGENTEVTTVAVSQTQGGATGTMVPAHPQEGATGTMVAAHPQGGATGTMVPAHPQEGATGTMVPAHPQRGATGTMVPAYPQGGATGAMVPAYPQGSTTMVQVQKQKIGNVNLSFSGGEANVFGDHNAITINRPDDEAKALMTDVKEMLSEFKQTRDRQNVDQRMPQKKSQKTSGTQTSGPSEAKRPNTGDGDQTRDRYPKLTAMIGEFTERGWIRRSDLMKESCSIPCISTKLIFRDSD
ncbi:Fibrinogen alpha chain [Mizuhopecten yessoensis]|uniref:Fibrinogen alpha chain n=1 Tax=Mizuhopecten yessoensis TaxID=6573 RepID=A0A210Q9T0_MIZYE|nr:Fibrinogen alpha chain [Mizuhopecten yessoensis]